MSVDAKRLQAVFLAALEAPDRGALLDRECGADAELRQRVEKLLAAHEDSAPLPAAPPERTSDFVPIAERPGSMVGPYKLKEQIGEGGFGLVFVAEQTEPVKRKVALKVIKPGMDSRQVIARFEAERQALALMDHPNIARALDAGATESGRPYFVMELVRGIPITEYCDKNQLAPRERLELFVSVCQAIQHAHQKGVIHRDVKPSNVLVTSHDGKPVAKVIDFGVAKAIHQQLTERSIYTNFAQMVGTPLYMSPEQAEMSGLDIDTRSDIYSLGVLLYELLTGTTPLDRKRFAKAAYDEVRRLIREEEPPKPSTRLSASDSLASIAAQRHMEPARLSKLVRGDLDWITMKCLEKDRTRRYETANGLARDIQRYLADEAVEACPPTAAYRLRKFAKKNRAALTTAATLAVLLVGGITVSAWQAVRATRAEAVARQAQRDEAEQRRLAEAAEKEAKAERDAKSKALEAEQKARQQAFAALRSMTDDVVERKFAAGQGHALTDEDRAFLKAVQQQWEGFAAIQGDDADSRSARAEGRHRVSLMRSRLGELKEAEADLAAAVALRKQLAADFPARHEFRRDLAKSHSDRGILLSDTGRPKEAEADYAAALALQKQLAADFPASPEIRQELARSHTNRGSLLSDTGRPKEAEADYAAALALQKQLVADFPADPEFRRELAVSHGNRGNLLWSMGRPKEAEADFNAAVALQKQLAADYPARPEFRQDLARSNMTRGDLLWNTGRLKEAEVDLNAAVALQKRLAADFPALPEFRRDLATSQGNRGILLQTTGRPKEAEADFEGALTLRKQLAADFPARPEFRRELATSYNSRANMLSETGRPKEAEADYDAALALQKQLAADFPARHELRQDLAMSHNNRGSLLRAAGRLNEAVADFDAALTLQKQLAAEFPDQPDGRNEVACTFVNLARLRQQQGDLAAAKRLLLEGRPHHQAALQANPRNPTYRRFCREHLRLLTEVHAGLLEQEEAVRAAETCRELAWEPPADTVDAAGFLSRCISIVEEHAKLNVAQRQLAAAFYADAALKLLRAAVGQGFKDAAKLRADPAFAPLQANVDFQKLLADLEAKGK